MNEKKLNDEEIELLIKALKLYSLSIELNKEYPSDNWNSNNFYGMVMKLEEIIGTELDF
jgi:hypothetical protein